jgi:hypothetical protein
MEKREAIPAFLFGALASFVFTLERDKPYISKTKIQVINPHTKPKRTRPLRSCKAMIYDLCSCRRFGTLNQKP